MYNQTANSLFSYDVIGEISIPLISYDSDRRELNLFMPIDKVFYPDKIGCIDELVTCTPEITPGISAFNIRLMNGDMPVKNIIAVVSSVIGYKVKYNERDDGKVWVELEFTFDQVETDVRGPGVPDVPILIKDIIAHNGFIALVFAGDYKECVKAVKTYRVFTHCGKVYHSYDATALRRQITADVPAFTAATIITACETEIPDESGKAQFDSLIRDYITNVYKCESTK